MKLIDLLELLTKLEKTPENRYADVYIKVDDNIIDLTDASFEIDDNDEEALVLHTENDYNDIS